MSATTRVAATLTPTAVAVMGRRTAHFAARSQAGVGRARMGSPARKRRRSSARARALA
jgi:hypothetical protein